MLDDSVFAQVLAKPTKAFGEEGQSIYSPAAVWGNGDRSRFLYRKRGLSPFSPYDVSSSRIKVIEWNQAPNGTYFPKKGNDTKAFEEITGTDHISSALSTIL